MVPIVDTTGNVVPTEKMTSSLWVYCDLTFVRTCVYTWLNTVHFNSGCKMSNTVKLFYVDLLGNTFCMKIFLSLTETLFVRMIF